MQGREIRIDVLENVWRLDVGDLRMMRLDVLLRRLRWSRKGFEGSGLRVGREIKVLGGHGGESL